jgi:hypothetical protein
MCCPTTNQTRHASYWPNRNTKRPIGSLTVTMGINLWQAARPPCQHCIHCIIIIQLATNQRSLERRANWIGWDGSLAYLHAGRCGRALSSMCVYSNVIKQEVSLSGRPLYNTGLAPINVWIDCTTTVFVVRVHTAFPFPVSLFPFPIPNQAMQNPQSKTVGEGSRYVLALIRGAETTSQSTAGVCRHFARLVLIGCGGTHRRRTRCPCSRGCSCTAETPSPRPCSRTCCHKESASAQFRASDSSPATGNMLSAWLHNL